MSLSLGPPFNPLHTATRKPGIRRACHLLLTLHRGATWTTGDRQPLNPIFRVGCTARPLVGLPGQQLMRGACHLGVVSSSGAVPQETRAPQGRSLCARARQARQPSLKPGAPTQTGGSQPTVRRGQRIRATEAQGPGRLHGGLTCIYQHRSGRRGAGGGEGPGDLGPHLRELEGKPRPGTGQGRPG